MAVVDRVETAAESERAVPAFDWRRRAFIGGPFLVGLIYLLLGYVHYSAGTAFSLSHEHYRRWAFPAFRYSDVVWLYLRDGLAGQPLPYVDYPLEYPPLTGLVSWLLSFAPDLPTYFALAYLVLAASIVAAIWALGRLPGSNPWYFAVAPAIFFYTGHQWDPLAVGVTALSLVAVVRGHDRLGALGLAAGVSLKLFPLAFLAAFCVERVGRRQWRKLVEIIVVAGGASLAFNLPVALANRDGWLFFFRWNRDRLADSGIWVLWRGLPTETLTAASMWAALIGAVVIALYALRMGGPILLPLGATALIWWLLVNKTFTTHLMLWVLLALALLRPPVWLWLATVAVDFVGFQLGNYLNLYNVPEYQSAPLIRKAVENIYDPLQIARSAVLLLCVGWGLRVLWRGRVPGGAWPFTHPVRQAWPMMGPQVRLRLPTLARPRRRPIGRATLLRWAAIAGSFLVAAIVLTWPLAFHLRDATPVGFDPLLQIWLSRWVQHALATNPLALYEANIFHPLQHTLAYTDANVPGALLAWPIDLIGRDPILTNNLMILASFVAAGAGMYAVVLHLTRNRAAAWIAGLAYAFLPYRAIHLWHLNWLQSAWLPWIFYAFLLLLERPTLTRGIALGLLAAALTLTSFYFSIQIALLLGVVLVAAVLARAIPDVRKTAAALTVASLVAALVVVPLYLPYLEVRDEQGLERTIEEAEQYKATADSYLTLPPWDAPNPLQQLLGVRAGENVALTTVGQARHADGHQHAEIVIEDALYPGLAVLAGALAALLLWRRRWLSLALALVAAVAFLLSLGPSWGPMTEGGRPLPYWWLFDHAPFFKAMRVPARLGGLVGFALVVLAGMGLSALWERLEPRSARMRPESRMWAPAALAAILALFVAVDLAALPVPLEEVDRGADATAAYAWLAAQPPGAVMEFPAESIFADPAGSSVRRHVGLSMLWSTLHWKPLVNGNSGFIPRSYSDFIERFVGNIPRPDGSLALRISHVDRRTVPLLQQIDVRYLVFHRSQYRPEDWPAVEARLAEIGSSVERVGDFGEATVYRVAEPFAPPPRPEATLYAPTLLGPDARWAPVVAVEKPGDAPSLLALTRPTTLAATWYDDDGRLLHSDGWRIAFPVVADTEHTLCTVAGCRATLERPEPATLPQPTADLWRPTEPGHYVVKLSLAGDVPLSCRVDLDVVDAASEVRERSPDEPLRWAECAQEGGVPVNDPGAPPFRVSSPSITFVGNRIALDTSVTTRRDEEARGWFLLAPPGDPAPWRSAAYQSPIQQRVIRDGEPVPFEWLETVPPDLPRGVYGLTIWFHRATASGWEHAFGGGFQLAPVVVDEGGAIRWAGPIRLDAGAARPSLRQGATAELELNVAGESERVVCDADWRLVAANSGETVAMGHAGACDRPRVAVPRTVPPGPYRLDVEAYATRNGVRRLSDGVALPVTVVGETPSLGQPR